MTKITDILKDLLKNETIYERKEILLLLSKHTNLIQFATEEQMVYPFLYINQSQFVLFYQEPTLENKVFSFSSLHDIHVMLTILLQEGKTIFFDYKVKPKFSQEEIWKEIHRSLQKNDKESFLHYSSLLKEFK